MVLWRDLRRIMFLNVNNSRKVGINFRRKRKRGKMLAWWRTTSNTSTTGWTRRGCIQEEGEQALAGRWTLLELRWTGGHLTNCYLSGIILTTLYKTYWRTFSTRPIQLCCHKDRNGKPFIPQAILQYNTCRAENHLNVLYAHLDVLFKSYVLTKLYLLNFRILVLLCWFWNA